MKSLICLPFDIKKGYPSSGEGILRRRNIEKKNYIITIKYSFTSPETILREDGLKQTKPDKSFCIEKLNVKLDEGERNKEILFDFNKAIVMEKKLLQLETQLFPDYVWVQISIDADDQTLFLDRFKYVMPEDK